MFRLLAIGDWRLVPCEIRETLGYQRAISSLFFHQSVSRWLFIRILLFRNRVFLALGCEKMSMLDLLFVAFVLGVSGFLM